MNSIWLRLAAFFAAQLAPLTKTKVDDRIAQGGGLLLDVIAANAGKPTAYQVTYGSLEILRQIAEQTKATGDEKLTAEFLEVVRGLERVVGTQPYRTQLETIEPEWPDVVVPPAV